MVYPTTKCWDYEDDVNFNTKDGIIPKALKNMIDRVTSSGADDTCTAYNTQISAALNSIESIRQWLSGEINEYTSYDESLIPSEPAECNPTTGIAEVREQKIEVVNSDDFKVKLFE